MASAPEIAAAEALPSPRPAGVVRSRRRRPSGEPPPLPRQLNASGKYWLALTAAVVLVLVLVLAARSLRLAVNITIADTWLLEQVARLRTPALTSLMRGVGWLGSVLALRLAWLVILAVLLATRRWRHLFVLIGTMLAVEVVGGATRDLLFRPRPLGLEILGPWQGFALPSAPVLVLAALLVNALYALVPQGRLRDAGKWVAAALVALLAFSRLYLAQDHPTDVLVAVVFGVTIPLVAFRLLVPNEVFPVTYRRGRRTAHVDLAGPRGDAIVRALTDQLGVLPLSVEPFGWAGSGGSTPMRVRIKGDPDGYLFCKLYTATHVRSDRWYKLGRTLLYGRLEDEKAFNSVRRLVQYEDYALRQLQAAQLPVPQPLGIVEITPEREYLLVMEFFDGAREIGEVDVDEQLMDQGLLLVRRLWEAGLAHRDLKPANLLVRDGRLLLIDSAFAQVRPSPWRQAVDLANMMLVLALRSDADRVYERARRMFTDDEIAEAFAATRGLTMPTQLRRLIRERGQDLHAEFLRLLPNAIPPVSIQLWTLRRAALSLSILVAGVLSLIVVLGLMLSPLP
jgi:tRNA A-37 threonylcarbamoyl transferase component Bud32/membrane-associated phospholipid phosphatase